MTHENFQRFLGLLVEASAALWLVYKLLQAIVEALAWLFENVPELMISVSIVLLVVVGGFALFGGSSFGDCFGEGGEEE